MKISGTIESIVREGLCTGCGTCVAICPLSSINMIKDNSKGIYIPQVNWETCSHCGICMEVCPGHSVNFGQLNKSIFTKESTDVRLGCYLNCYTGYATDCSIRYNSASGGLVTALLIFALEEGLIDGALVTRMNKEKPLEPLPFIARTKEEIISSSKSIYCPVPANVALGEILRENGRYAVVGLPCHIHGVRKVEEAYSILKTKIILHLGLFCIHSPNFIATEFLLWQKGITKEDVTKVDYRDEGWPGGISIYLRDGQRIFISYDESWKVLNLAFFNRRCTLCCDGSCELADISFGDAWCPEFSNDKNGTSAIISRTPKAEELLQCMVAKGIVKLNNITAGELSQTQQDFRSKKASIKVYTLYEKIWGHRIPEYNTELIKLKPIDIIDSSLHLLGLHLSSKQRLWRLVPIIYERLIPFLSNVQKILKRLIVFDIS